jgi:hypothetical protein
VCTNMYFDCVWVEAAVWPEIVGNIIKKFQKSPNMYYVYIFV